MTNENEARLKDEKLIEGLRADYKSARHALYTQEKIYAGRYGTEYRGSPLKLANSLADLVAEFVEDEGRPLSYREIVGMLEAGSFPYSPTKLKNALKQGSKPSKTQRLVWKSADDPKRPVRDDDLFDIKR